MKFNKDNLIALMGDVAVQLGVPEDKREAAGVQCFNSMAISFDKIARSENKERKAVGLSVYPLLPPEDGLIRSLEGLDEKIFAMTLKNNIRPYVSLYQEVPMHEAHHESQNKETDMQKNDESPANDYSTDPRYQAQIEGLQKMTAALNASSPEYQEPSEAENNRRISEKEERKAVDWAIMQDGASEPKRFQLSENKIRDSLANEDEGFNPAKTGYYASVEELAEKVRSAKNWSQGEVFVFAESEDKFVVMKQIAPSSCEMLTITQDGYKDVLTAYRFEQDELVAMVKGFMGDGPVIEAPTADGLQTTQQIEERKTAIFDVNAGFLQWLGEAKDHASAINAMNYDVGLWEARAEREDVEASANEDSLRIIEVSQDQAAKLETWASHGFRSSDYPDGLDSGVVYSKGEVLTFLDNGKLLENESLQAAQKIGKQKELVIQADPAMGNKYEGKILGVTDQHVVVSLGRSALIVDKRDVDRVPAVEDNVKLAFAGGKGVFEVVKGVGVER